MSDMRARSRKPFLPGWAYGLAAFAIAGYYFMAMPWMRPLFSAHRAPSPYAWLIALAVLILRILDIRDRPIRRAAAAIEEAKDIAKRRQRAEQAMQQSLQAITPSGFTPKPGEICYWAQPNAVSQDGFSGSLYITNERLVFITPVQSYSYALDAIVAIARYADGFKADLENAPPIAFNCGDNAIAVVLQRVKLGYIDHLPDGALPKSAQVVLLNCGPQKIRVVKLVREALGCGLTEAVEFVDKAPRAFPRSDSVQSAEALKARLEAVGARVELE